MSSLAEVAFAHQNQRTIQAQRVSNQVLSIWNTADRSDLDLSWQMLAPGMVQLVSNAQVASAKQSAPYIGQVSAVQDFDATPAAIVPQAFAGVTGDGRELGPAMFGSVTTSKTLIGGGAGVESAFQSGAAFLATVIKTAMADAGRNADRSLAAGKGYTRYIRVVNGSACSRCAILAGIYSSEEAFLRHASCQCSTAPITVEGKPKLGKGLYNNPQEYFDSLSKAEQDRIFTKDGAEAIRAGADPAKVVNARRGAYGSGDKRMPGGRMGKTTIGHRPDGTPIQVYSTSEGTYRGEFRKAQNETVYRKLPGARYTQTTRVRLMPETIFRISGDDLRLQQAFLRDAGYMDYGSAVGYGDGWIQREAALRREDRILVNRATLRYGNFTLG